MKKLIALIFFLSITFISEAQSSMHASNIAKEFFKEGEYWFNFQKDNKFIPKYFKYNFKIEPYHKKDINGDDLVMIVGYPANSNTTDTLYCIPDFPPYPMAYCVYRSDYIDPNNIISDNGNRTGDNFRPLDLFISAGDNSYLFYQDIYKHRTSGFLGPKTTYSLGDNQKPYIADSEAKMKLGVKYFMEEQLVSTENLIKLASVQWEACQKYVDQQYKIAEQGDYDDLMMDAIDQKGISYILKTESIQDRMMFGVPGEGRDWKTAIMGETMDFCKISFLKDPNGELKEMKFHFPYIDGVFHDKEQFYFSVTKNNDGIFEIAKSDQFGLGEGNLLIPMDGMILILDKAGLMSGANKCAYQVIGKEKFPNGLPKRLITLNVSKNKNYLFMVYNDPFKALQYSDEFYTDWKKRKELWTQYEYKKDQCRRAIFTSTYARKLINSTKSKS